jgi:signal transduction histidine kinase
MSFRLKTILGIALIEAVLLLLLIWSSLGYLRTSNEDELSKRAQTVVHLFGTTTRDAILSTDVATLESAVQEVLKNPSVEYARVRGRQGVVLAEGGRAELLQRPFHAETGFDSEHDGMLDVAENIVVANTPYGRVEIGLSTGSLAEVLASARQRMEIIALVEMAMVALFSFALGTYLTRGLAKLQQASRHIAAGELTYRLDIRGKDELAETAQSFNRMSSQLQDAKSRRDHVEAQLAQHQEHLELLVTQRTSELTLANNTLRVTNSALQAEKARQEELIRKLAEAHNQLLQSEKMASIGQLAAGVAHEINNPIGFVNSNLGTLKLYVENLLMALSAYEKNEGEMTVETRAVLTALKQQIDLVYLREDVANLLSESMDGLQRVKRIVQDLKDFSHVDEAEKQSANLERGLDSTLNVVWNELKYKTEVIKEYAGIPSIMCMPAQLNQVFMNLLMNAGQAIEEHGRITIRTGQEGENVWVEVEDTGKGISPEHLKHIFDPFFTTKPVGSGTGLGLSLSYGIVQKHGGRIEVKSTQGKGTTMRVWLPVKPDNASQPEGTDVVTG